jgi:hypothetical protein
MATVEKKESAVKNKKHPLDHKFSSVEQAAKAKTDHLLKEVLKGYNINKLQR